MFTCTRFSPPLHVQAHRLERGVEHASVGGKQQPTRPAFQIARQSGKIRIGSPVRPGPVEPDRVPAKINLTDSVRDTLIIHWLARSAAGQGAVGMGGKARCCRQKEDNPSHNGPLMGFGSFLWLNLGPPAARSVQTPQECLLCLPRKQQANMAQLQTRLRCACVFSVDRPARSRWQGEMIRVPQRLKGLA